MIIWFDQALARGALVLGTSNKTEVLLGYTTWFGDSAASLQPSATSTKPRCARSRALWRPRRSSTRNLAPTFGPARPTNPRWASPMMRWTRCSYLLVDERMDAARIVQLGFDAALVARVRKLISTMQYKRMMPVIAKVGSRTPGVDFRYPRDWGR